MLSQNSTLRTGELSACRLLFLSGMNTPSRTKALVFSVFAALVLGASSAAAAPGTVQGKAGSIDPATLKPSDWASWPEVSIPTVAEVQASCFDVERQCRKSGTAASICAKEKRSCLAPTTL
jgi:hypothetical protein